MKVFILCRGDYSDTVNIGVYSTRQLAEMAADVNGGWVDDNAGAGYEVDGDEAKVKAGVSRWKIIMDQESGHIYYVTIDSIGTGEAGTIRAATDIHGVDLLFISCDARDKDHAIKIASDERAQYIAVDHSDAGIASGAKTN